MATKIVPWLGRTAQAAALSGVGNLNGSEINPHTCKQKQEGQIHKYWRRELARHVHLHGT